MNFNNEPAYVNLLQKLKTKRNELGWTQVRLGKELGRPQGYVAKVETGNQRMDMMELHRWATALDLDALKLVRELFSALEAFPRRSGSVLTAKLETAPTKRVKVLRTRTRILK